MATEQPTEPTSPETEKKRGGWHWKKNEFHRKTDEVTDNHLIEKSRYWHQKFVEHLAGFTAFQSTLDITFANDWSELIDDFENLEDDETMADGEQEHMDEVKRAVKVDLQLMTDVENAVKLTFPNDQRILKEFGFELARKALHNRHPGIAIIEVLLVGVVMLDYEPELLAAGVDVNALKLRFDTGLQDLLSNTVRFGYAKRQSISSTTLRVRMFNKLWDIHISIRDAAKSVFPNDEVKQKQFE
jgi:hypothetical protein